jgi:hypothetical protein
LVRVEQEFPYTTRIILRTSWRTHEQLAVNHFVSEISNDRRSGTFNSICRYHFARHGRVDAVWRHVRQGLYPARI